MYIYLAEGFSVCLNPYIRRIYSFEVLVNRKKYLNADMLSPWQTKCLLQVCGKMLHSPIVILTIHDTISYVKAGTWCQDVRHQIGDPEGPIPIYC